MLADSCAVRSRLHHTFLPPALALILLPTPAELPLNAASAALALIASLLRQVPLRTGLDPKRLLCLPASHGVPEQSCGLSRQLSGLPASRDVPKQSCGLSRQLSGSLCWMMAIRTSSSPSLLSSIPSGSVAMLQRDAVALLRRGVLELLRCGVLELLRRGVLELVDME